MSPVRLQGSATRLATRAAALGVSGFAALLFTAPGAHADTTPSTDATTGPATPTGSDSPTAIDSPTSTDSPTPTDPPTSTDTPTSTDSPSATDSSTSSDAPTTPAPTSPAATSSATSGAPVLRQSRILAPQVPVDPPSYGTQKVRVGVQLTSGDFAPPGYSLANAKIQMVVTDEGGTVEDPTTCLTDSTGYCPTIYLDPGASAEFTQLTAPDGPGLLVDPTPQSVEACTLPEGETEGYCGEESLIPTAPVMLQSQQAAPVVTAAATAACSAPGPFCQTVRVFNDPGIPPTAANDTATVLEGKSVTIHVTANDDTAGAPATVALTSSPAHGTAKVSGSDVIYTSTAPFGGVDTFTYSLTTANGTSTAKVSVTVKAPPIAVDDTAKATSGKPVTIDVLANDNAEGGGTMTISAVGTPGHGTAKVSDGKVVYTPSANFAGTDTFTYTVTTANGSATATVTVSVVAPVVPQSLSATGVPAEQLVLGGSGLLGSGLLLLLGGRRRRRSA